MNDKISMLCSSDKPLRHLNQIVKKPTLHIEFQDVIYSVKNIGFKGEFCQILKSISGKFCCGELTAILGPSGSGKTTLLNVLAGYVSKEVRGKINVNNSSRDLAIFNKLSSYILQENIVQPHLSVLEALTYATRFKLGSNVKDKDKEAVVQEIIDFLGLQKCIQTRSEFLSGGEKKKLTIALELINNPPVIFLDEPTTGLDEFAAKHCIDLLKKISKLDRTVICTIHQPSSLTLSFLDQIYFIADGYCVYNGGPDQLISFLSSTGHPCPSNYNPIDYMTDLVYSSSEVISNLRDAIQNGKINLKETANDVVQVSVRREDITFPVSSSTQLILLISRMLVQMKRNRVSLILQFLNHLMLGLTIGSLFSGVGNDASHAISILKMGHCTNIFFAFSYSMVPTVNFPPQVELLRREYFNRWYGLKAYYLALTIVEFMHLYLFGSFFAFIVYFMCEQPMELDRIFGFLVMSLMIGLCSQALGRLIGSIFNEAAGAVVISLVLGYLVLVAMYGLGYKHEDAFLISLLEDISYLKYGAYGLNRVVSYNRRPLVCNGLYCHYTHLEYLFQDIGIPLRHYVYDLIYVFIYFAFFEIAGYFALKCRFNVEFASRVKHLIVRLVGRKC